MESNFTSKDIYGIPDIQIQKELEVGLENLKKKDMENKYFTPSIEDIRVGYECEVGQYSYEYPNGLSKATEHWTKKILTDSDVGRLTALHNILKDVDLPTIWVRVPYLTKEQIEADGWVANCFNIGEEDYGMCSFKKGNFECRRWSNGNNYIEFYNNRTTEDLIYEGGCKCINDFRYICKLLNIK